MAPKIEVNIDFHFIKNNYKVQSKMTVQTDDNIYTEHMCKTKSEFVKNVKLVFQYHYKIENFHDFN